MSDRMPSGGRIDRDKPLSFTFDGQRYRGFAGDTLASALLANGVAVVGRSFKYHRPRGIFGIGSEEPNALMQIGDGGGSEPNIRATQIDLFDGLVARSQNNWPSLRRDVAGVLGLLGRFLPAGFYYKTFMWPARLWPRYEDLIRRTAGMGKSPNAPDPDIYEKRHAHCDVLIIGAGPAGREVAKSLSRDETVWLADEGALEAIDGINTLPNTTVFGAYDDQLYGLVERREGQTPRQILWLVRAGRVVLAAGAIERPLVFANNDRPGVMLASAAAGYVTEFAVRPGKRAVIVTNNDSAHEVAETLAKAGMEIAAIVDHRHMVGRGEVAGCEILHNHAVIDTAGGASLTSVTITPLDVNGDAVPQSERRVDCDLLCVSGGFTPSVHLYSQAGGKLAFDEDMQSLVPKNDIPGLEIVGAARGDFIPQAALVV